MYSLLKFLSYEILYIAHLIPINKYLIGHFHLLINNSAHKIIHLSMKRGWQYLGIRMNEIQTHTTALNYQL